MQFPVVVETILFSNVPAGQQMTHLHAQSVEPIFNTRDNINFSVETTGSDVTVTNNGMTMGSCTVYLDNFPFLGADA